MNRLKTHIGPLLSILFVGSLLYAQFIKAAFIHSHTYPDGRVYTHWHLGGGEKHTHTTEGYFLLDYLCSEDLIVDGGVFTPDFEIIITSLKEITTSFSIDVINHYRFTLCPRGPPCL